MNIHSPPISMFTGGTIGFDHRSQVSMGKKNRPATLAALIFLAASAAEKRPRALGAPSEVMEAIGQEEEFPAAG